MEAYSLCLTHQLIDVLSPQVYGVRRGGSIDASIIWFFGQQGYPIMEIGDKLNRCCKMHTDCVYSVLDSDVVSVQGKPMVSNGLKAEAYAALMACPNHHYCRLPKDIIQDNILVIFPFWPDRLVHYEEYASKRWLHDAVFERYFGPLVFQVTGGVSISGENDRCSLPD